MFTFLIADDEKIICSMIERIINWEELGFRCIGSVNNGIDALNCIKKQLPDLVITDIRMPGIDGIQLVKDTVEAGLNIKFIMISGFRQFEYAQGAMRYGVKYYLLKPLDKDELEKAVRKVYKEILTERREQTISDKYTEIHRKVKEHFLTSNLFPGSENHKLITENLTSINKQYETQFTEGVFQGIFVKIDSTDPERIDISLILSQLADFIEKFGTQCEEFIKTEMNSGLILLINYRQETEAKINTAINALYDDIDQYIKRFEGVKLTIGIGTKENTISRASSCLETAISAVKYRLRFPNEKIIHFSSHNFAYEKIDQLLGMTHFQNIKSLIEAGDANTIIHMIDIDTSIIQKFNRNYSPLMIYDLCTKYFEELQTYANSIQISDDQVDNYLQLWKLKTENDDSELELLIDTKNLFKELIPQIQSDLKKKTIRPIREAKEYIDHHFHDDLSLNQVADIVQLNASYLSTMFKKEYHITFSDYITNCRIEQAKDLLTTSKEKITTIAYYVGYHDSKYFSKLFLKIVGLKPSEYRKLYS